MMNVRVEPSADRIHHSSFIIHHSAARTALRRPAWLAPLLLVVAFCASGASCPGFLDPYSPALPRVLPTAPTLNDVIAVVNSNSSRIQSLYTTDAQIYVPGAPMTWANIAIDRPRRFRLRAETRLTGPEVDVGSNDELFWFWVRRSSQPAVYYCRHAQFATSIARQLLPVEPAWLIDALGVASLDPAGEHSGPIPVGQGRLRIETRLPRPEGDLRRIMIVDDARGWVLEQHLYDAAGRPLASAIMSGHRPDPVANVILPRQVKIIWPPTRFEMTIELNNVLVNQLGGDPQQLWSMPGYTGYTAVDLADPNLRLPPAVAEAPPPAYPERSDPIYTSRAPGGWLNRLKPR
ncbi:MAG: hypothetical protein HYX69_08835 [Planctomycetia bacterium]|nr:hypothetical protein [Planctomycetia bacterium]